MRCKYYWLVSALTVGCTASASYPPQYASQPYAPAATSALDQPTSQLAPDAYDYDVGPQYVDVSTAPAGNEVTDVAVFYD
ncbi:MAG TPA: hypothetical protein VIV40_19920, partial [Kofleriaceae bacterium]